MLKSDMGHLAGVRWANKTNTQGDSKMAKKLAKFEW